LTRSSRTPGKANAAARHIINALVAADEAPAEG